MTVRVPLICAKQLLRRRTRRNTEVASPAREGIVFLFAV